MTFFDSPHCSARVHCRACRATGSPAFRASIAAAYSLPVIDFECPHGVPWNTPGSVAPPPPTLSAQPARLGDTLAALFRLCGLRKRTGCGCSRRQSWLNSNQATVYLIVGMAAFLVFTATVAAWLAT